MRFKVTVFPEASFTLPEFYQQKLARRAARKVLRMGSTTATVIFPGPRDLRVIVNCQKATIVIATVHESTRRPGVKDLRKSA